MSDLHTRAQKHRQRLKNERGKPRQGFEGLTDDARDILSSYGHALLELGKGLDHAVELLDLSGELRKPEVADKLKLHLESLSRSKDDEDMRVLTEVSKRIARIAMEQK